MKDITEQDYISQRLEDQLKWYSKKSSFNKNRYRLLKSSVIAISVTIPFLAGLIKGDGDWLKIAVGVGGVMVALLEGLLSLFKYQDLWLEYRVTAEQLKREKILYETGSGPYKNNKSLQMLVERTESILSTENQSWLSNQQTTDDNSEPT